MSAHITFRPAWKEELWCSLDDHGFVLGAPMGMPYLVCDMVSRAQWEATAPGWASGRWEEVLEALLLWAARSGSVEVTIGEPHSWVSWLP